MIGHKRVPSRAGGVEVAVEQLTVRMAALGHEVTVYNRGGSHMRGYYRGVRTVPVPAAPAGRAYSFTRCWPPRWRCSPARTSSTFTPKAPAPCCRWKAVRRALCGHHPRA
jgi:hypothetical protein